MEKVILKNGMELTIRSIDEKDAEKIAQYKNLIGSESDFMTFGANEAEFNADKEYKAIKEILNKNNSIEIIALIDGEAAGLIVFRGGERKRTMHAGELGISVRKEFWGMGIGGRLMENVISWAKKTGIIRKINLRVRTDNNNAVRLYKKYEFREEGIISRDFQIDNKFYDSISMGLLID